MALSTGVLIAFAGLALDVGLFWTIKRHMHTAADAGAIAAATAPRHGQTYQTAAKYFTSLNGFTDDKDGVTVTVNNPPASGPHAGNADFVEVIVSQPRPAYFLRVLGYTSLKISARAVAGSLSGSACIYALDPTASGALHTDSGSVPTLTTSCGVMVDSSSSTAITASGRIDAPDVGIVGKDPGYSGLVNSSHMRTGVAPAPDPLAYLEKPAVGACASQTPYSKSSGTWTINPGLYCGGIKLSGTANVTLNPGTYVLNGGGLSVTDNAKLTGIGVTFYNTGTAATYKPIYTQDQNTLILSAPTSGALAGILFFQDPSISSSAENIIAGGSAKLEGALYFPTTPLVFSSQSTVAAAYTIIVAKTINVQVNSFTVANDYSSLGKGSPIKASALYE